MVKGSYEKLGIVARNKIRDIIAVEGGFVDHPDDPGGATNFGVTERRARLAGFTGAMKDMPEAFALDFYAKWEWINNSYRLIEHYPKLAGDVFDFGVNAGHNRSVKTLQRSLNLMNRKGADWKDLLEDGFLGRETQRMVDEAVERRGELLLRKVLNVGQGAHYWEITSKDEKFESFFNGWIKHRIEL